MNLTDEQLETIRTGQSFASMQASLPYKQIMAWLNEFSVEAGRGARTILGNIGADRSAYERWCIRRDTAEEIRDMIQSNIEAIKGQAAELAKLLKEPEEG